MLKHVLIVIATGILPVAELRGAIPLGILVFDLHPLIVLAAGVAGTMAPVFGLLLLWPYLGRLAKHWPLLDKALTWLFERTRARFYNKYQRYGDLALILFVAIPLPVTGVWTGSAAAYIFGISYRRALLLIFLGALISGVIMTIVSLGVVQLF